VVFEFFKCLQRLSIEINLFLPVNTNTGGVYFKTMNEELLAAGALLVQSGASLVNVKIKLA
jgi:hypothetical protein